MVDTGHPYFLPFFFNPQSQEGGSQGDPHEHQSCVAGPTVSRMVMPWKASPLNACIIGVGPPVKDTGSYLELRVAHHSMMVPV